jgi:hypothetical protein
LCHQQGNTLKIAPPNSLPVGLFYFMSEIIKHILFEDAYWKVNKTLVKKIGIEPTVLLTDIIEKYYHFIKEKTAITRDGKFWFYYRSEDIKENFGIGYKVQKRIIAELTDGGFIVTKLFQTPAKLHIHFIENTVEKLLLASIAERINLKVLPKGENNIPQKDKTNKENIINTSLFNNKEDDLFSEFIKEFNVIRKSGFHPIQKVKVAFKSRLKTHTKEQIIQALKNAMRDNYHIENQFNHLTPEFITRPDKLEMYLNYKPKVETKGIYINL